MRTLGHFSPLSLFELLVLKGVGFQDPKLTEARARLSFFSISTTDPPLEVIIRPLFAESAFVLSPRVFVSVLALLCLRRRPTSSKTLSIAGISPSKVPPYLLLFSFFQSHLDIPSHFVMSKLKVTFLINKAENRVVFAKAGSDFIDVLFSFLTLPLGRIAMLLDKKSGLGSLDAIYESISELDRKYMQTDACKEMLLNPRSAAAIFCENLKINITHDADARKIYFCDERKCLTNSPLNFSYIKNNICPDCSRPMIESFEWPKETSATGGIFVNESIDFLITDDLEVMPVSLVGGYSLKEMKINNVSILEEKIIDFDKEEVLKLLGKSLASKNPLSQICFPNDCLPSTTHFVFEIKDVTVTDIKKEKEIDVLQLILNKKTEDVLYAEVDESFVNQLLSFLTFPLGSVIRLLSYNVLALDGCIHNLYSSVEKLSLNCFKSEDCKNMLLFPKLAVSYKLENQMLDLQEIAPKILTVTGACPICHFNEIVCTPGLYCKHNCSDIILIEQQNKLGKVKMNIPGAYVCNSKKFIVADNLKLIPLSAIYAIKNNKNILFSDIVDKKVCFDKNKVLLLLNTMLISKTALTDVFRC